MPVELQMSPVPAAWPLTRVEVTSTSPTDWAAVALLTRAEASDPYAGQEPGSVSGAEPRLPCPAAKSHASRAPIDGTVPPDRLRPWLRATAKAPPPAVAVTTTAHATVMPSRCHELATGTTGPAGARSVGPAASSWSAVTVRASLARAETAASKASPSPATVDPRTGPGS